MALFNARIDLEAAIKDETMKLSNARFEQALPRFIAGAEQRMFYGALAPMPSEPIRLRAMEATADVAVDSGEGEVPADYLEARRLLWDGSPQSQPLFEPPQSFWSNQYVDATGTPARFTIEGATLYTSPKITGDVSVHYYALPAALADPNDVNDVLTTHPMLYLRASLIEAYGYLRNAEKQQESYGHYTSLLSGLLASERRARVGGNQLVMRVPNARI